MGASKQSAVVKLLGLIGGFLLNSLKASTGAKNNADLITDAFNTAGGYILSTEQDVKPDGTPYKGLEKLERVAKLMGMHYAAQGITLGITQALTIAQNKFLQMDQEGIINKKEN